MNARFYIKVIISLLLLSLFLSVVGIREGYGAPDTETLRPNASGIYTQWAYQLPVSGFHWDKVDEATSDGYSTCISDDTTSYKADLYNIPSTAILANAIINSVTVYMRVVSDHYRYKGYVRTMIRTHSTNYYGSIMRPSTSWVLYFTVYATNPNTGSAWTIEEINALEIGVSGRGYSDEYWIYCTQVYIVIDYSPAVEAEWHDISVWNFNLTTRQWLTASTWNFNLSTMQWTDVVTWSFNLTTMAWQNIATWNFNMTSMAWNNIATWDFNLSTMQWQTIATWGMNLTTRAWHTVTTWTFNVISKAWQNIAQWSFNLISLGWHTIAYWTITLTQRYAVSYVLLVTFAAIILLPLLFAIKKRKRDKPKYEDS